MDRNTRVIVYADTTKAEDLENALKEKLGLTYVAVLPSNYAVDVIPITPEEPDLSAYGIEYGGCDGNCACLTEDDVRTLIHEESLGDK